jgi:hypothetical protein
MTHDYSALLAQLDALKSADVGAVFAELIRAGMQALIEAEATQLAHALGQARDDIHKRPAQHRDSITIDPR